jgi:hypothetical protein
VPSSSPVLLYSWLTSDVVSHSVFLSVCWLDYQGRCSLDHDQFQEMMVVLHHIRMYASLMAGGVWFLVAFKLYDDLFNGRRVDLGERMG